MANFVKVNQEGRLELDGKPFMVHCAVYFGRYPGECGGHWLLDPYWTKNRNYLDCDFSVMQALNINSVGLFIQAADLIKNGKSVEVLMNRLDQVIKTAASHSIRVIIFHGQFIDNPCIYKQLVGKEITEDIDCWHPTYSNAIFDAYVHVMSIFANRYKKEPFVLGYMDRIDRFVPTFGRRDKIIGLEYIWWQWLEKRYRTFSNFLKSHPNLIEKPKDFSEVKLPQDLPDGFSMHDSRAYEYALMQRTLVGETQGRFDREIKKLAPRQIVWTPFEGVNLMNPILDGYIPTPKILEAVWAEYYPITGFSNGYRVYSPVWDASYVLLPKSQNKAEIVELPEYVTQVYLFTRWLKQSQQNPVILCHGHQMEVMRRESPWEYQQKILIDRTNRACMEAGGDGWAYWCWSDDATSRTATMEKRKRYRNRWYQNGETMGIVRWDGSLRPVALTVHAWGRQLATPLCQHPALARDVLILLPEPKMMIEQEPLSLQTATAICSALLRAGTLPQVQWTATTRDVIGPDDLKPFRLVVLGDSTYQRDHREVPQVLLEYVKQGGILFWPVYSTEWLEDEFGCRQPQPALSELSGCNKSPAKIEGVSTVEWVIEPTFETIFSLLQGEHSCTIECENFAKLLPDASTVEVIACAKFKGKNWPLFYRHRIGKGVVYIFTWSFNVFRDDGCELLYGGDEWDWLLTLPMESAGLVPDLTTELGGGLRDQAYARLSKYRKLA